MHRRGDDPAEAQRDRARQDRNGHIVFVDDLFPEIERGDFGDGGEGGDEDENAEAGVEQRVDDREFGQDLTLRGLRQGWQPLVEWNESAGVTQW